MENTSWKLELSYSQLSHSATTAIFLPTPHTSFEKYYSLYRLCNKWNLTSSLYIFTFSHYEVLMLRRMLTIFVGDLNSKSTAWNSRTYIYTYSNPTHNKNLRLPGYYPLSTGHTHCRRNGHRTTIRCYSWSDTLWRRGRRARQNRKDKLDKFQRTTWVQYLW